jgi:hypothetical protein
MFVQGDAVGKINVVHGSMGYWLFITPDILHSTADTFTSNLGLHA